MDIARFRHPPIAIGKFYVNNSLVYPMTKRLVRIGRCYRCNHTWQMRRRVPSLCPRCKSRLYDTPRRLSPSAVRRLYRRFESLPEPNWDGIGPVSLDLRRRRAKDELLVKYRMRASVTHGP